MCNLKSAIILKDSIFIPDYDSHTQMLEELGIKDTRANAEKLFIRAELYPANGDVFSPIENWVFNVDQDITPEWYVENYDKERMYNAVKKWAKDRIHIGVDGLKINAGANHFIKDCKNVEVYGSASINRVYGSASINKVCDSASINKVCDSASIKYVCGSASIKYVCDSASINEVYGLASINEVYDSASIKCVYNSASINEVYDSASINKVCDSASIKYVCGSASIKYVCDSASINEVYGSAIIAASPFGWNKKDKLIISDNATFKDNSTKTIWQSGDWTVKLVKDGEP